MKAEVEAKAKGQWWWAVFLAPLLRQISLTDNGILDKIEEIPGLISLDFLFER